MSLRLIYGRAGSGKSRFCLNDIKARLDKKTQNPLILIVPEQFSLQADRNMTRVIGSTGIQRADVLTFRRMAYRVFNEVGGLTHPYINSAGKCMIIYRIMEALRGNLKFFFRAASRKGFVNTMLQSITEMKRYNVTPELLQELSLTIENNDGLRDKLEDMERIYNDYQNKINEKYMDSTDDLTLLAEKLERSAQFDDAEIWIDEFAGFTPQEYNVIEKLLHKVTRVNISLCTDCLVDEGYSDGVDVFAPVKNTSKKLIRIAKENNIQVEQPVELAGQIINRFSESKELLHLKKYYFSFPYKKFGEDTRDISIFTAVNIYSEVEETAREIIALCRDGNLRYRDIAVVARNLSGYEKLVTSIFNQFNIPCFIDSKRDINNHPLVMLILSALEIFQRNWSYESVFRYLKTGLTGIAQEDIDILENYVLACGIKGSRWLLESWKYRPDVGFEDAEPGKYELEVLSRVNEIRPRVVLPLADFRSKTKGRNTAKEICTALFDFLCEIGVPDKIEQKVEEFKALGEQEIANEYSQVWNIVMEVFDQVVEVIGDERLSLEKFNEVLAIGLGEYQMGLIPASLDQVLVGSVERSKSHEIKALFVLGVNDGVFPVSVLDEGILTDRDREILRQKGMELAQDTRAKTFEEQFNIYTTLTTASNYLRISYPLADQEGSSMRPSSIIFRLRKLFPNIQEISNITKARAENEGIEMITSPAPTFNQLISILRKKREGIDIHPLWTDVYQWFAHNEDWKEKCKNALNGLTYINTIAPVNPEKTKKLYGTPMHASVSRLEKFAACPFAFFAQYGLKAKDRKILKLSAPDTGIFLHTIIDKFSKYMEEHEITWRTLDRELCDSAVSKIVDEQLLKSANSIFNSSQRYKYIAMRLKRVVFRAVWMIAEHIKRSSFEPIGYEIAFGEGESFPPIELELPSGDSIKLTGRIDRVDTLKSEEGTYLRIVDYKSGNKAFKLYDVYYGLQIQLITYLNAVLENGGKGIQKPVIPGGILYFKLDDPIIRAESSTSEEEIETTIMKQLKMKGLLLADVKLIKEMDNSIEGDSLIIPARINKGDVLGRSSAASIQQFEMLRKHIRKLLTALGEEILGGDVSIKPYKKKRVTSCMYCNYASICQFDSNLSENKYKILPERKDEEVWELIETEAKD